MTEIARQSPLFFSLGLGFIFWELYRMVNIKYILWTVALGERDSMRQKADPNYQPDYALIGRSLTFSLIEIVYLLWIAFGFFLGFPVMSALMLALMGGRMYALKKWRRQKIEIYVADGLLTVVVIVAALCGLLKWW